jgi:hypothetical protein
MNNVKMAVVFTLIFVLLPIFGGAFAGDLNKYVVCFQKKDYEEAAELMKTNSNYSTYLIAPMLAKSGFKKKSCFVCGAVNSVSIVKKEKDICLLEITKKMSNGSIYTSKVWTSLNSYEVLKGKAK